jgi:hypothetical protein
LVGLAPRSERRARTSPIKGIQFGSVAWRTSLPYSISYALPTGTARRIADTAASALLAYGEMTSIGAEAITIRDEKGVVISCEELKLAASLPINRDRGPRFST